MNQNHIYREVSYTAKTIKYVLNPEEYQKANNIDGVDVRQAELFCMNCSTRASVTKDNVKTLPASIATHPIEEHAFEHSPLYSGRCLRPECK